MDHLLIAIVGNRNSGKSYTWNCLFGREVRTGQDERELPLGNGESVSVFLVSGSPQERKKYVEEIVQGDPQIVLCSLQYKDEAFESFRFFFEKGYSALVHWLNPGRNDGDGSSDELGLIPYLLEHHSLVGIRNGKAAATSRVEELRDFIRGWASSRNLITAATSE